MATTVITNRYRPVVAPRLPSAPMEYNAQYQEQFMNILRLYFNQLDNLTGIVLGESGGRFIRFPYGAFSSDQDQTTTANTATLMTLNTTDFANQVSISSSKITVVNAGLYNLQFSVQFQDWLCFYSKQARWNRRAFNCWLELFCRDAGKRLR